jgi:hypothetical protein
MKLYSALALIIIAFGFVLAGCSRQNADSVSTPEATTEESKRQANNPAETSDTNGASSEGEIVVYKSPTCGCCTQWESHLSKAGFKVVSKPTDEMTEIRKRYKVPENLQSCHTATINGYVIEGHVPAGDVKKLLEQRPAGIAGLAAPGMPPKSPGMQPEGEKPAGYDVLSFDARGNTKVFASY